MRYLLDTQLLLWIAGNSPKLPAAAREVVGAGPEFLIFSVASLWEITIKAALGRDDFVVNPTKLRDQLLVHRYTELPVNGPHALAVLDLPPPHGDPFDRLLIAQARHEGITLVTTDKALARYGDAVLKV